MNRISRTQTSMLLGTFRLFYSPAFHELEALDRIAHRYRGQQHSFAQWTLLLRFERGEP